MSRTQYQLDYFLMSEIRLRRKCGEFLDECLFVYCTPVKRTLDLTGTRFR